MEATKTEYKGIVFDSKSEAVFARALDLAGQDFIYHPKVSGRHQWDFLVFPFHTAEKKIKTKIGGQEFESTKTSIISLAQPFLVEYKPSHPSWTYVGNLFSKGIPSDISSFIVWGSPWNGKHAETNKTYNVFPLRANFSTSGFHPAFISNTQRAGLAISRFHCQESTLGLNETTIANAFSYRFDLQQEEPFPDAYFATLNAAERDETNPICIWKSMAQDFDNILGDFAGRAMRVNAAGNHWEVVFPKGSYKSIEYVEQRLDEINNALIRKVNKFVYVTLRIEN